MPYVAEKPKLVPSVEELKRTIPGWGVDLESADRPAVPKERFDLEATGAHWHFPERQTPRGFREHSNEHASLTPVFGTACPLKGLSGVIRRYAYDFSEGRTAHWLLLVLADRVDVVESRVTGLLRGRPDNPITETGILAEVRYHGWSSRIGRQRADLKHLPVDFVVAAGSTFLAIAALYAVGTGIAKRREAQRS